MHKDIVELNCFTFRTITVLFLGVSVSAVTKMLHYFVFSASFGVLCKLCLWSYLCDFTGYQRPVISLFFQRQPTWHTTMKQR